MRKTAVRPDLQLALGQSRSVVEATDPTGELSPAAPEPRGASMCRSLPRRDAPLREFRALC